MPKKTARFALLAAAMCCLDNAVAGTEQVELEDCRVPTQVVFSGEEDLSWSGAGWHTRRYVQYENGSWEIKKKNPAQSSRQGPLHAHNYTSVSCGPERFGQTQWITATLIFEEQSLEVLDHFILIGHLRIPTNLDFATCPRYDGRGIILWGSNLPRANTVQPERFVRDGAPQFVMGPTTLPPNPACPNAFTFRGAKGGFGNAKLINESQGYQPEVQKFVVGREYRIAMHVYPHGVQYQITDPVAATTSDRWEMREAPGAKHQSVFDESIAPTAGAGFAVAMLCKASSDVVDHECNYINADDSHRKNVPFRIRFKDIQMGWW
jgi:hypothetical protein